VCYVSPSHARWTCNVVASWVSRDTSRSNRTRPRLKRTTLTGQAHCGEDYAMRRDLVGNIPVEPTCYIVASGVSTANQTGMNTHSHFHRRKDALYSSLIVFEASHFCINLLSGGTKAEICEHAKCLANAHEGNILVS
jgi:hypothetical protein